MLSALLYAALALSPRPAAWLAALVHGRPDIAPALVRVCERESRCQRIGVHARDAHLSRVSWGGQVQLGHLDAECQPYGQGRRWATRGAFGLNAADHWQRLPPCYWPEVLDVPLVSALVSAGKYLDRCEPARDSSWCPARTVIGS